MDHLNTGQILLLACALFFLYALGLAIYRLYFHPLAGIPGPKLAALTRYYEAYFDVYKGGVYTLKIGELHEKYGMLSLHRPFLAIKQAINVNN